MNSKNKDGSKILEELGAKPSESEEHGLALLEDSDLSIFSPGISTAGFAEIRMARGNPRRRIIATTIDQKGLQFAEEIITGVGLQNQIETKLEDVRYGEYPPGSFDFIYARLVLHYLSSQDLDKVLAKFSSFLKPTGRLFVVVRSEKNIDRSDNNVAFDPDTHFTTYPNYDEERNIKKMSIRYFHTPESMTEHMKKSGFRISNLQEYEEQLYKDFMRREISPNKDHVIEIVASK